MSEERINRALKEKIVTDIRIVISESEKLEKDINLSELDMVKIYIDYLRSSMDSILSSGVNIFRAITIIGNLTTEIERIEALTLSAQQFSSYRNKSSSPVLGSQFNFIPIKNMLKNVASYLWQFLAKMTNLSQWSVSGNAAGNFLGLSGGVTIQITFEK